MIGWLKGTKVEIWSQGSKRGIVINCSGVGYEVQLLERSLKTINEVTDVTLWTHQLHKEDGASLFGFLEKTERDLFRKLINVNGVGPQLAISLLEKNTSDDLVKAIIQKDIPKLMQSNGVGKRIGERLVLELENKLDDFTYQKFHQTERKESLNDSINIDSTIIEELRLTLKNLEYDDSEILQALKVLSIKGKKISKDGASIDIQTDFESLLKESIIFLSQ